MKTCKVCGLPGAHVVDRRQPLQRFRYEDQWKVYVSVQFPVVQVNYCYYHRKMHHLGIQQKRRTKGA